MLYTFVYIYTHTHSRIYTILKCSVRCFDTLCLAFDSSHIRTHKNQNGVVSSLCLSCMCMRACMCVRTYVHISKQKSSTHCQNSSVQFSTVFVMHWNRIYSNNLKELFEIGNPTFIYKRAKWVWTRRYCLWKRYRSHHMKCWYTHPLGI